MSRNPHGSNSSRNPHGSNSSRNARYASMSEKERKRKERAEDRKPRSQWASFVGLILSYCIAFVAAYWLTWLIYRFTGQPPEPLAHLISGIVAVMLVMLVWRIIILTGGQKQRLDHGDLHDQLTYALGQMAQGNFDVMLNPDALSVFNELAEAINDMAHNLGTLEAMRQDFISNVSHEIQSPLTSIRGFAELLQKDDLTAEERQRYAAIIEAESIRLSSLSENLLKLSALDGQKTSLCKVVFRLDKQLEHVALTLEPQWAAKGLALEADLLNFDICGDEDMLLQVWMNLLHNAIKFTPDEGRIDLSLTEKDGCALVRIADTGVGISAEDQIHIFERFYKVDKARDRSLGGNGLGLSIVKKIVEMHGGSIEVESEPGEGTSFTVKLPTKP